MDGLGAGKVDTGIDDEGVVGLVESASDGACEVRGVSLSEAVSVAGVCDGVEATSAPSRRRCLSSGSWSASDDGLGASRLRRRLLARGGKGSCGTEYQGSCGSCQMPPCRRSRHISHALSRGTYRRIEPWTGTDRRRIDGRRHGRRRRGRSRNLGRSVGAGGRRKRWRLRGRGHHRRWWCRRRRRRQRLVGQRQRVVWMRV